MDSLLSSCAVISAFPPGVVVPVRVPSMGLIDLFENYQY